MNDIKRMLIENGQPQAAIVIGAQTTPQARAAAEILQSYLARISGCTLPICVEGEKTTDARVLVGHSETVKSLGVNPPSGATSQMNEEGFIIKTVGKDLVIAGNEDWHYRGTVYGVYHALEMLGCRWFFPGAYGEVVPKMDTVTLPALDLAERPDFRIRNIWYSGWMPVSARDRMALHKWYDCNKVQRLQLSLPSDGSITRLAPPERYFDSQPEIYAVDEKGERSREMLCLSEPKAVEIAVKTITDAFCKDPTMFTFGFAPPDGQPMCHCERCLEKLHGLTAKHLGRPSLSDAWFSFVDRIARAVQKEFPDRWLLTNGYANRVYPPEGVQDLSRNVGIQLAMLQSCTLHRIGDPRCWQRQDYDEILKRWTKDEDVPGDARHPVLIYDYDPGVDLSNLPFPTLHNLKRDIPLFHRRGVWGFWTEGHNAWMRTHLNYYIRAKLMWNAEADVDALARDYCENFYGPAADAIERYIWTQEEAFERTDVHAFWRMNDEIPWRLIFTDAVVAKLESELDKAARLADAEPYRLRVKALKIAQDHLTTFLNMRRGADEGRYGEALAWTGRAQRDRDQMAAIDPALLPNTPDWVAQSACTSLEGMRRIYKDLADRVRGELGDLVVMLPETWQFKTDPFDDGLIRRWYLPNSGGEWQELKTTLYWENQGHQDEAGRGYVGLAWYRTAFNAPSEAAGRPLRLAFGGVYHREIWVWLNGVLAYYSDKQPSVRPFDIDVTEHIRPGQTNYIAVRLKSAGVYNRAQGGIYRRVFVWSPNGR